MAVRSWITELVGGLRPWQRGVLVVSLCTLALSLWFAAGNTDRYLNGQTAVTEGYVYCESDWSCRGEWTLADGSWGQGSIDGLNWYHDEEAIDNIPLFGGRDWAVTDRETLLRHALAEYTVALAGAALITLIAWRRSKRNQDPHASIWA
ncbi:hypothetical protein [Streptomyces sp. NPDC048825]|uniref:hypothetical protein n=1 Tax=Streptomyces sp. NPDC048825 TaxID=3365592 RepID=UPI00371ECC61